MSERPSPFAGVQKIERGPLREQVQRQIRQLIVTNRLRPGQLIVIDRLADELGVSHTPVREALAMLEHDGLVQMRPYENPRVSRIELVDIREAWEMRLLLEGWAISRAVPTLSEEALDYTEAALAHARKEAEASRFDSHLQSDIEMHEMIVLSTGNRLFKRLAQLVNDQSVRIRWLVESVAPANEVLEIIDEHCAVLAALRARESELARERLTDHLKAGLVRTLRAVQELDSEEE